LTRFRILAQLIFDGVREMRFHARQHIVEIIEGDLDKLAVFQAGQRLLGLPGEISKNSHHEGELFQFDRVSDLHIVADVNARRTDAFEFFVYAFSCHCYSSAVPCRSTRFPPLFGSPLDSVRFDHYISDRNEVKEEKKCEIIPQRRSRITQKYPKNARSRRLSAG